MKYTVRFLFILLSACFFSSVNAQSWQWIRKPTYNNIGLTPLEVRVDSRGCNLSLSLGGGGHIISKHDAMGNLLWINAIPLAEPGGLNWSSDIATMELDRFDNIYIVAKPITAIGGLPVSTPGPWALVKLNPLGKFIWARQMDGNINGMLVNSCFDGNRVYLSLPINTGDSLKFNGQTFLSYGPSTETTVLMAVDTAGNTVWANRLAALRPNNNCYRGNAFPNISVNNNNQLLLQGDCGKTLKYENDIILDKAYCGPSHYAAQVNGATGAANWAVGLDLDTLPQEPGYTLIPSSIFSASLANGYSAIYQWWSNYDAGYYYNASSRMYLLNPSGNMVLDTLLSPLDNWYRVDKIATNNNSDIFTIGIKNNDGNQPFEIRKYNAAMDTVWTKRVEGEARSKDYSPWAIYCRDSVLFNVMQSDNNSSIRYAYFGPDSLRASSYNIYFTRMVDNIPQCSNSTLGKVFFDLNQNGRFDVGSDYTTPGIIIGSPNADAVYCGTNGNGNYLFYSGAGQFNFKPLNVQEVYPNYNVGTPAQRTVTYNSTGQSRRYQDFAITASQQVTDGSISITPVTNILRPGTSFIAKLVMQNVGTTVFSSSCTVAYDTARLIFQGSNIAPVSAVPGSVTFNMPSTAIFDTVENYIGFMVRPIAVPLGDTTKLVATLTTSPVDGRLANNVDSAFLPIRTSFDPNEKQVYPFKHLNYSQAVTGQSLLDYKLYFQNTGTDTAFVVSVKDTLDSRLDITTFKLISSSHPVTVQWHEPNVIEFYFPNILLPYESQNEPGSHGFVRFSIRPKTSVILSDTIFNSCSIYFDYNLPVKTNTVENDFPASVVPIQLFSFTGRKEDKSVKLYWNTGNECNAGSYEVQYSNDGIHFTKAALIAARNIQGLNYYTYTDRNPAGPVVYYRLKMIEKDGRFAYSPVLSYTIADKETLYFTYSIVPGNSLQLSVNSPAAMAAAIKILDVAGRTVYSAVTFLNKGNNPVAIRKKLSAGTYFISIITSKEAYTKQVMFD